MTNDTDGPDSWVSREAPDLCCLAPRACSGKMAATRSTQPSSLGQHVRAEPWALAINSPGALGNSFQLFVPISVT